MKVSLVLFLLVAFSFTLFPQEQKSVSITVYNANLGVVKDYRRVNIPNGLSDIRITDVAQHIDPTSVHIKLNGSVLEQNYQYDLVSLDKILQKYIDKNIQLIGEDSEFIEGTLLSAFAGQVVIRKKDGGLVMLPNVSKYRYSVGSLPDGLITKPTLVWKVNSAGSGNQDIEISYQTGGMNWHAEYVAVLNENDTRLDLNSWVSITNNSGTTFKDAKLKLVAGDLNLIQPLQPTYADERMLMKTESMRADQFQERDFFEYHIYDLQRPSTLAQNETKQISLFETSGVKAVKKYLFRSGGANNYNPRGGTNKVNVVVEFENSQNNNLGVPMPKGKVRVYKVDGEAIEFIGEDLIDHTPRNESVKLKIGDAFDIVAEEVQTDYKKITDRVYEQAFEIKIKNRKKEDITVEVEKHAGLFWEVIDTSVKHEKKDAQTLVFQVPVKADSENILKLRLRYNY
jgi:hypothetical protein